MINTDERIGGQHFMPIIDLEGWIDNQHWEDRWLMVNTLCWSLIGRGQIDDQHWKEQWSTVNTLCQLLIWGWGWGWGADQQLTLRGSTVNMLIVNSTFWLLIPPPPSPQSTIDGPPIGLCWPTISVRRMCFPSYSNNYRQDITNGPRELQIYRKCCEPKSYSLYFKKCQFMKLSNWKVSHKNFL